MKTLFDGTMLNKIQLKNRLFRAATWENTADKKGHMTKELFKVYEDLAKGGVGLIITGYAYIMENEQPNPGMIGIYDDSFIKEYQVLTDLVHRYDSKIILQIVYGGSQTNYKTEGREIWGASPVPHVQSGVTPTEMTKENIRDLVVAFADAAERSKKAGFDGVQFHGAHGYLLNQFLSPYYNRREDEYGGSVEKRSRIIFEVYEGVRERVGVDFNVLIKLNCDDFMEDGATFEECKYVATELAKRGIDAIEISGGKVFEKRIEPYSESVFRDYAAKVANLINIPVILLGTNRNQQVMEKILNTTKIEYFSMARPFLRQPDLVKRWQMDATETSKCISCNKCFGEDKNQCIFVKS